MMKFAYLISAFTDPPQLKRLVEALHPDAHFFIHIDKHSSLSAFTSILQGENIHFLQDRIAVRWGTITQVDFQIALIEAALNHPVKFDRLFFLSGQDYPLWSNDHITRWMEEHRDQEMLCGVRVDTEGESFCQQRRLYQGYRPYFHFPLWGAKGNDRLSILYRKTMQVLGIRKPLTLTIDGTQWHLYKGADYWCISRELAAYIDQTYRLHPEIRRYFSSSFAPSETMMQTIAFNHPVWAKRCILWQGDYPGLATLTPLHFIIYDPIIKVMDETDYDTLMASGRMFTRKLVSGKSDQLIQRLHDRT